MADCVSRRDKRKTTISSDTCVNHYILLLKYLSNHNMQFITNGYKRFSKTNSTDLRQRVPLNMLSNRGKLLTNFSTTFCEVGLCTVLFVALFCFMQFGYCNYCFMFLPQLVPPSFHISKSQPRSQSSSIDLLSQTPLVL